MASYISHQPKVLVFDSGVGGLSVYKEIKELLPHLEYIYLFDNKAYPYGELDRQILINRVQHLVSYVVEKHSVDIVVIACNTASTVVLPRLRQTLSIPVIGVVPAIKPASLIANKAVGLIATPATIKREYTHALIKEFAQNTPVKLLGSTVLVDMAEGKLRGKTVDLALLDKILAEFKNTIDVAVLGCTHFPLLKEEIGKILGESVILVDSGKAIAERVKVILNIKQVNGLVKEKEKHRVYSSATPYEEAALNVTFERLGFKPIEILQIPDA